MIPLGVCLLIAGAAVVAMPDDGERLFSLSETHGPSLLDACGIVLLLAGWGLLVRVIWRGRRRLAQPRSVTAGAVVSAVGAAVLVTSIMTDAGWWWLLGAALLASVQATALWVIAREW